MADFTFLDLCEDALNYKMDHKKAGKCIIFDHEHFDNPKDHPRRLGTKVDVERIHSFFEKTLGFEVTIHNDLAKKDLVKYMQNMADQDFTQYNCFVCCILTHGTETHLHAFDGKYELDMVISFFTTERCPSLAGKPKLFFIQACQGTQMDPGHQFRLLSSHDVNQNITNSDKRDGLTSNQESRCEVDGGDRPIVTVRIPIFADILVAYSTVPKFYSYRDTLNGSWFFEVLIEVFEQNCEIHDLLTMLTMTKQIIAYKKENESKKQIPWITDTLTRRVVFNRLSK